MNGATLPWAHPEAARRRWIIPALVVVGATATAVGAVAGDGNLLAAIAPAFIVATLGAIWLAPMRITLYLLVFFGLAVDAAGDGGPWQSPLAPLGRLVTENLDRTIYHPRVPVPLMALVLGYLLVIHLHRLMSRSRIDHADGPRTASPLSWGLGLSLLTVVAMLAFGARTGGDIQMVKNQVQNFVLLLLAAYLLAVSLRGTRDYRILGGVIIAAACSKALLAVWVYFAIRPVDFGYMTYHGDSILWASAMIMLLARFAEQPTRRNALLCLGVLPLLAAGLVVNNRRIAWVEIAVSVLALFVFSRRTRLKRMLTRAALVALPVVLVYVSVGWTSDNSFFAPLQVFRSVQDAEVDASTLFRDLEDLNLLYTLSWNPFLGTGLGHPFAEAIQNANLSFFKEYRYLPHNSVLGLWAFCGAFGFSGLSMAWVVGVFLAARSYHWARSADERVAALSALAIVMIYLIQCYGDIGFSEREAIFLVGSALAVSSRLALSTGAWGARPANAALASS